MKKITLKWLEKVNACPEAVKWFKEQENKGTVHLLRKATEENHFDWSNWAIVRLMTRKQRLAYK